MILFARMRAQDTTIVKYKQSFAILRFVMLMLLALALAYLLLSDENVLCCMVPGPMRSCLTSLGGFLLVDVVVTILDLFSDLSILLHGIFNLAFALFGVFLTGNPFCVYTIVFLFPFALYYARLFGYREKRRVQETHEQLLREQEERER